MQCPKCQFEQNDSNQECRKCGVIFAKHQKYLRQNRDYVELAASSQDVEEHEGNQIYRLLFPVPN